MMIPDLPPLQHLQPGGPGVFRTRRYDVAPYEGGCTIDLTQTKAWARWTKPSFIDLGSQFWGGIERNRPDNQAVVFAMLGAVLAPGRWSRSNKAGRLTYFAPMTPLLKFMRRLRGKIQSCYSVTPATPELLQLLP